MSVTIAALYKFAPIADPAAVKKPLAALTCTRGVRGTILLAQEGVNGTIAGSANAIADVLAAIRNWPGFADLEVKFSSAETMPFRRLKVRVKQEIVTLGQPGTDPRASVGRYVPPADWNALLAREDVVAIDTRNAYETAIGSFDGAIDPETESFRDFPAWWEANRDKFEGKTIAMFCTGGIRCEKSTSWLISQGVRDVCHLQGGILKYLETVPEEESLWRGECFVFDDRVAVRHGLEAGTHDLCHACRRPINATDKAHPAYRPGVSCPACIDEYSDADRARFAERQKQIALARARGEDHLGS